MQTRIVLTFGAVLVAAAARIPSHVAPVAQAAPGVAQPSSTLDDQVELREQPERVGRGQRRRCPD